MSLRILAASLAFLGLAALLGPRAVHAAPDDVAVPNVVGNAADVARQALENRGLTVVVVDIAGPPVGRVERQEPPANTRVPTGTQVMLRVGIALRVETRVPDLRGKRLPDVGSELEQAYVLEVELVPGQAHEDGRILDQSPAPGQTLLYRGVLALRVVQAGGGGQPAGVIVPVLIGRTEAEAMDLLQPLGLAAAVEVVEDASHAPGTVVSQAPPSGSEMLAGGTVSLRVVGSANAPPPTPPGVPVPNFTGLGMNAALQAAQAAGFVPQVEFLTTGGGTPWTCVRQEPAPGNLLAAGSPVTLSIALPGPSPQQLTVPTLFGLQQGQAIQMLGALGLNAAVQHAVSGFPAGLVFAQEPQAGAPMATGGTVKVFVAQQPPGGWNPGMVKVPNVVGLTPPQAYQALQAAHLTPKGKQHIAPNRPVDQVDAQLPPPGSNVLPGTEVRFYVPVAALVPTLFGKTRNDAIQILQAAGFNPQPQGPAFGFGGTVVIAQGAPAGVPLARGSDVAFAFKFTGGPPIPVKTKVPNVMGLSKNAAIQALQQKGLGVDPQHQGPNIPGPGTKVTGQNPPADALVNPGTVVQILYVDVPVGPPNPTQVPNLVGLAVPAAQQALANAALQGSFNKQGPTLPGNGTKVVSQQPIPGTIVPKGSNVNVTFVEQFGPPLNTTTVPNLVNLTVQQAQAALTAKDLQGNFVLQGPAIPFQPKTVIAQQTAPGTVVPKGTTITATYKQSGGPPPGQVAVPNVVNMTRAQAQAVLQGLGFQTQFNGPPGPANKRRVINQNPSAGNSAPQGATVTMTVVIIP
jgi:beta-lactam-binding protein with PASTA domain